MGEVFDKLCPYYIQYGMTYDQYWHGDPWALRAYKQAYLMKRKSENFLGWLNGIYTQRALAVVIHNAFSRSGTPPLKYYEEPLDIFPKTEAEKQADMEKKQDALIAGLGAWKDMWDSNHKQ